MGWIDWIHSLVDARVIGEWPFCSGGRWMNPGRRSTGLLAHDLFRFEGPRQRNVVAPSGIMPWSNSGQVETLGRRTLRNDKEIDRFGDSVKSRNDLAGTRDVGFHAAQRD